jgi:hypothetical protein
MKTIRKLHFWIGTLFAPTILFFAFSGAMQVLGLHEASGGESAPAWIAKLAQIHKDQSVAEMPHRKSAPRPDPTASPRPPDVHAQPHRSTLLVIWFLVMAISLTISTGLGIYMAFAYKRDRIVIASLLAAGTLIPIMSLSL